MSDKLENALAEAIEKANSGIDTATEFLVSELPEVIQQALMWYTVKNGLYFLIGVSVMVLWSILEVKAFKYMKEIEATDDDWFFIYFVGGLVPRIAALIFVCCFINLDWLKILIAPKLWLIEYAAKLAS